MYLCTYVSMYLCIHVSMYLCISVSMYLCLYVPMYRCSILHGDLGWKLAIQGSTTRVSMCLCIYVFMYLCIYVSMLLPISTGSSRSFTLQQFLVCEKVSRDFRGDLCLHFRVEVDVALLCERFLARGSFLGVGARGRRPFESADPGGARACGAIGEAKFS